jgi:ribosome biogenesis GTPase A
MDENPYIVMERIAIARAALQKGGEADINKASRFILEDFRSGKLGRISLEQPN